MTDYLIEDAGRLFEAGFMLGVIRALGTLPTVPAALAAYREQRETYPLAAILDRFVKHVPSMADRDAGKVLGRYYLFKGHVSGYTFLREYIESLVLRAGDGASRQQRARQALQVRYWQCTLLGDNRLEELPESKRHQQFAEWMEQLNLAPTVLHLGDSEAGGFLRADLLLWIQHGQTRQHDILVVDTSIATTGSRLLQPDLTLGRQLLRMLESDITYLAEKGAFTRLAIETGEEIGHLFTRRLTSYFTAFASTDKESSKLIQAASYAYNFQQFAQRTNLFAAGDQVTFHIVGYSGRAVNSMTLRPNQSGILEACKDCPEIYSDGKRVYREEEAPLDAARQHLYEVIRRATASLFQSGQDLIQKLHERVPEDQPVEHWETLRGTFQNTATLPAEEILQRYGLQAADLRPWKPGAPLSTRDAHATLIGSALKSRRRYLFLTGNPGIGKTTSIANYLKECCHGEGYLLFYASPRKAVNRDIFSKFQEGEQPSNGAPMPFYTGRFLGLSTNATLIRNAGGGAAVEYVGTAIPPPQSRRGVRFLTHEEVEQQRLDHGPISTHRRVTQVTEDVLHDRGKQGAGVLQTICTAIGASLDRTRPNSIVASIAIQSLKRSEQGKDTLDHLYEIFASAYNHREGAFLDAQMRALANTTKHIIIMIDEITGDEAGYEFFRRVSEWLDDVHLEQYGFQPTIIVSDASITGVEVVRAHFRLNQHEPDARKIYLMLAPPQHQMATTDPISLVPFSFDQQDDAYLVNSNSYPANALHLRYKIRTPLLELSEQMSKHDQKVLLSDWIMEQGVDQEIIRDVCALLEDPTREGQTIVYIQDKRRLQRIIQAIEKRRKQMGKEFLSGEHYVQIHADSSESEREHIEDPAKRDRFLVIFMTSSASRGLTFSKARHLLVDVARFTIETNLMEIIQVLYRGRGGEYDLGEKYVTFYLSDRIIAHVGRRDAGIREGLISLMTMLSLLKMCLMTRIAGSASLRDRPVGLIPIGGKSVSGSGRAYHHDLANFARALRQQLRGPQSNDPILTAVHKAVTNLMDHVQILPPYVQGSYLSLYENNSPERLDKWLRSDEQIEDAYVLGNLLLVPMAVDTETIHHFGLSSEIATAVQKETFSALRAIRNDPRKYPPTIHDGAKDFQQLLYELQDAERSQRLEQRGGLQQGYYVVPLTIFVAKGPISAYCRELREQVQSDESTRLRNALYRYVRDSYPVDTLLPIASWYHDFPFLVITSQDLKALRAKTFQTGHTLMSREMNLLTLLLSDE